MLSRSGAAALSVAQLQQLDQQATTQYGIPALLLMEHAGEAVARAVEALVPDRAGIVVCVAGSGHNGGDGLAAVRLLHTAGYQPQIFLLGRREALTHEPALYANILTQLAIPVHSLTTDHAWAQLTAACAQSAVIVDAVLGIGWQGPLRADAQRAIAVINDAGRPVVAVDVPSGLAADTGAVSTVAVRATTTVTFGAAKQGFGVGEGPAHTGRVEVATITYPPALLAAALA